MSGTPAIAQAVTASSGEDGRKVFVGNLAYTTTAEDLRQLFAGKGNITDAQIIIRGQKSLGYGFVTFESENDAAASISAMDKSEINGRAINVEIAKPPGNTRRGNVASEAAQAAGGEASTAFHERTGRGRRNYRGRPRRGRGGRRPPADGEAEVEAGTDQVTDQLANLQVNGTESAAPALEETGAESGEHVTRGSRRGRGRGRGRGGRRRAPLEGETSKTMVFVANLPFSIDDEGLKAVFQGLNVTTATVVLRKGGPAEGKSKGFGFVEFASENDQQQAIQQYHGHEIEGRELQVKVAIDSLTAEPNSGVIAE